MTGFGRREIEYMQALWDRQMLTRKYLFKIILDEKKQLTTKKLWGCKFDPEPYFWAGSIFFWRDGRKYRISYVKTPPFSVCTRAREFSSTSFYPVLHFAPPSSGQQYPQDTIRSEKNNAKNCHMNHGYLLLEKEGRQTVNMRKTIDLIREREREWKRVREREKKREKERWREWKRKK